MRRKDYFDRWAKVDAMVGFDHIEWVKNRYADGLSSQEIVDELKNRCDVDISPRSIQRTLKKNGVTLRDVKTSFQNAISRNRVVWHWKECAKQKRSNLSPKTRMCILKRDKYKCRLCGSKDLLEIDHIIAIVNGGDNKPDNLRVLCHECNYGKRLLEHEQVGFTRWSSGKNKT